MLYLSQSLTSSNHITMHIKSLILSFVLLTLTGRSSFAQTRYTKFLVDKKIKDTFSFAQKWDYSWEIYKNERTGEFTKNSDEPLTPEDTAHLSFTADCSTNVQGGYAIRYCSAVQNKSIITLTFADGLPAYASSFYIYISGDHFYFKPKTSYPLRVSGRKISHQVTQQKLMLNNAHYTIGDTIMGYVDAEFIETISIPKKGSRQHTFYLRGYFRTLLK